MFFAWPNSSEVLMNYITYCAHTLLGTVLLREIGVAVQLYTQDTVNTCAVHTGASLALVL